MRVALVVNPASGRGRAQRLLPEIVTALNNVGMSPEIVLTHDGDEVRHAVRRERDSGAPRVLVCGGDGTLHLAIQELAGGGTALGIIPAGTGDDNARTLGIPRGHPEAAAVLAATGPVATIDLGGVRLADGTQRYFLGVMSTGFDSLVNERANRMRWPHGSARYLVATLGELRTFRPVPYTARLDGEEISADAMLVAIGNGASYGGGMKICPGADPADGLLEITWIRGVKTHTFLRVFPQVFSGGHVTSPYVMTRRVRSAQLEAPGQLAYADGERIGPLPASVSIEVGALPVVCGSTPA